MVLKIEDPKDQFAEVLALLNNPQKLKGDYDRLAKRNVFDATYNKKVHHFVAWNGNSSMNDPLNHMITVHLGNSNSFEQFESLIATKITEIYRLTIDDTSNESIKQHLFRHELSLGDLDFESLKSILAIGKDKSSMAWEANMIANLFSNMQTSDPKKVYELIDGIAKNTFLSIDITDAANFITQLLTKSKVPDPDDLVTKYAMLAISKKDSDDNADVPTFDWLLSIIDCPALKKAPIVEYVKNNFETLLDEADLLNIADLQKLLDPEYNYPISKHETVSMVKRVFDKKNLFASQENAPTLLKNLGLLYVGKDYLTKSFKVEVRFDASLINNLTRDQSDTPENQFVFLPKNLNFMEWNAEISPNTEKMLKGEVSALNNQLELIKLFDEDSIQKGVTKSIKFNRQNLIEFLDVVEVKDSSAKPDFELDYYK